MTVDELRELLERLPDGYEVWLNTDAGIGEVEHDMLRVSGSEERVYIDTTYGIHRAGIPLDEWRKRYAG